MNNFITLIKKDLIHEIRSGETLTTLFSYALLLTALLSFGVQNAFLEPIIRLRLLSPLIWILFIFTASISFSRAFRFETEKGALNAVILTGTSLSTFFIAKCVVFFLLSILLHTLQTLSLSALLQTETLLDPQFMILSLMVLFAYVPLLVFLLAISDSSKLGSVLLPILTIPLLFPLFFAATELTQTLSLHGTLDYSSFWFSLVLSLDIFYLVFGTVLFPKIIKA